MTGKPVIIVYEGQKLYFVRCPYCDNLHQVQAHHPNNKALKPVDCYGCGQRFTIPGGWEA